MSAQKNPEEKGPLSPQALKTVAEEVAGIKMSDDEIRICANRMEGLLPEVRALEKLDLGELEPLYTVLMPKED